MSKNMKANSLLLLTSFIWGSAFVGQSLGMDYLGPFAFNGIRFFLAGLVLLPVMYFFYKKRRKAYTEEKIVTERRHSIIGGIICGVILFTAAAFQQVGILYTSVGNTGFITALYIMIVPILSIFLKKRVGIKVWISVFMAIVGLYLLCIPWGKGFTDINVGDVYVLVCAFAFALHILTIDHFSDKANGIDMSGIQFFVCAILNLIVMGFFETTAISDVLISWKALLYTGILSGGVGYTLQIVGQKDTDPTIASLILSLESVFAAICGYLILDEVKSTQEVIGCCIMFAAIILAQLPSSSGADELIEEE